MKSRNSALILSDGSFYLGEGFGADLPAYGELVFNTSMTGYQEALTDPSYAGQVLTFAYPLVGNYVGRRDCHVDPDWLLIYRLESNAILFERTGTHADLFG